MYSVLTVTSRGVPETFIKSIVKSLNKDLGAAQIISNELVAKSDIHIEIDFDRSKSKLLGDYNV